MMFFVGYKSGHVVVWDVDSKVIRESDEEGDERSSGVTQLHSIKAHRADVQSIAVSPDGSKFVTASLREIKLWDVRSGEYLKTFKGHSDWVSSVSFSRGGSKLLSGSNDKSIKLWDVTTGECLHTYLGHSDKVNKVVFSHDSLMIASASDDASVKIWDTTTGDCIQTITSQSAVLDVALSPKDKKLVWASHDAKKLPDVTIWKKSRIRERRELHNMMLSFNKMDSDAGRSLYNSEDLGRKIGEYL